MLKNIINNLNFINITREDLTLFDWKPPEKFKSYLLDLNILKEKDTSDDIFFHLNKGNMKIVYIKKDKLFYTIGADENVQYQILEALLEYIDDKFNEVYDVEVIASYGNISASIFKSFSEYVDELVENIDKFNLVRKVDVFCRVCKKRLLLYIKTSMILNAISYPVPLVFSHAGHSIVTYIDQNFVVRGVEVVAITG